MNNKVNTQINQSGIDFYSLCRMNFKQLKTTLKGMTYEELYNLFYFVKDVYIKQNDMLKRYGSVDKGSKAMYREEAKKIYNQFAHTDKDYYKTLVDNYVKNKTSQNSASLSQKDFYKIMGRLKKYEIMAKVIYFEAQVKAKKALEAQMLENTGLTDEDIQDFDTITANDTFEY